MQKYKKVQAIKIIGEDKVSKIKWNPPWSDGKLRVTKNTPISNFFEKKDTVMSCVAGVTWGLPSYPQAERSAEQPSPSERFRTKPNPAERNQTRGASEIVTYLSGAFIDRHLKWRKKSIQFVEFKIFQKFRLFHNNELDTQINLHAWT